MLVLSRREGESLFIDVPGYPETIEIKLLQINFKFKNMRFGIEAPKEVLVRRDRSQRIDRPES